jgi:peptidoglycan/LPS O-acetylase OafA/YrhL
MEPEPHKVPIRFYEIDFLRFLAALSVVIYYYTYRGGQGHCSPRVFPKLVRVTRYGYLGGLHAHLCGEKVMGYPPGR